MVLSRVLVASALAVTSIAAAERHLEIAPAVGAEATPESTAAPKAKPKAAVRRKTKTKR